MPDRYEAKRDELIAEGMTYQEAQIAKVAKEPETKEETQPEPEQPVVAEEPEIKE